MTRSAQALALFLLPALLLTATTGCAKDETLSATKTIQAIYRARWTGAMLDRALLASAPLRDIRVGADLAQATDDLESKYGDCMRVERTDTTSSITFEEQCSSADLDCFGRFTLSILEEHEGAISMKWLAMRDIELQCNDTLVEGQIDLQRLTVNDAQPYEWLLRLDGFAHSDSRQVGEEWQTFAAAKDFGGSFYVRPSSIETPTREKLSLMLLAGNGTFEDVELARTWAVDAQDTGMEAGVATPRTGTLHLRTTPESTYVFQTDWLALSSTATRLTVRSNKQQWVGCISHGDAKECQNLGF